MTVDRRLIVATAVLAALTGCTGGDSGAPTTTAQSAPSSTTLETPSSPTTMHAQACAVPEPEPVRPDLDRIATVFVFCGDGLDPVDLRAVSRVVPDDGAPLRAAINQLLIGVTPQEHAAGLRSAFSSFTAGQLRGASIADGTATLDFTSGFASTNNFSTPNLGATVYSQVEATVFQFTEITGLEFEIDGQRWCGWENTCDGQPVPLRERP